MSALDLFCGLGGWSDGLALEGFDVLGVEIEPKIAKLYKHPIICQDIRTLDGSKFKDFDLIVGSPPCRDFSQLPDHSVTKKGVKRAWKRPKQPEVGLILVNKMLKIIKDAEPKYWLMENVKGLIPYMGKPKTITNLSYTEKGHLGMKRCFWGTFPLFFIYRGVTKGKERISSSIKKWERAKIPLPIARALGRAVKEALNG